MAINQLTFREELYLEHLEEAAFHYETRLAWLQDDEVGWQDLTDIELALEAHIDAFIVGGKLALALCVDSMTEADFSTLHVIVRVFCRYRLFQYLSKLWDDFDFDDEEKVIAVADALKWECPKEWVPNLVNVFNSDRTQMFSVVAPVLSYHSPESKDKLVLALNQVDKKSQLALMKALSQGGKILQPAHLAQLKNYLVDENLQMVQQAAIVMLMAGDNILAQCRHRMSELPLIFAIAGNLTDSQTLIELAKKGVATADSLLALGLTGNLESVPHLVAYLQHPDYAPVAAQALHLITGAALYEEVHEAHQVEKDELFEHELNDFKKGILPKNIDGDPYGVEVQKLTLDQIVWSQWLQQNKPHFSQGMRYRNGALFSANELLNNLIDNQMPYHLRQLIYAELVIRYQLDLTLLIDDLVFNQKEKINQIHQWIQQNTASLKTGCWS